MGQDRMVRHYADEMPCLYCFEQLSIHPDIKSVTFLDQEEYQSFNEEN